LKRWWAL